MAITCHLKNNVIASSDIWEIHIWEIEMHQIYIYYSKTLFGDNIILFYSCIN